MKKFTFGLFFSFLISLSFLAIAQPVSSPTQEIAISAIRDLIEDNKAFLQSKNPPHFKEFLDIQNPRTTAVLCSDSRVQLDNFSKGAENDMFVVRNIGNQITTSEGSVDYGVDVLKTPVLLIVGHSHCGAIKAAHEMPKGLPKPIEKELSTLHVQSAPDEKAAVILNVHNQVDKALKLYKEKVQKEEAVIIGAVYDFRNDYGLGQGRLIIVNLNGEKDPKVIQETHYFDEIETIAIGLSQT